MNNEALFQFFKRNLFILAWIYSSYLYILKFPHNSNSRLLLFKFCSLSLHSLSRAKAALQLRNCCDSLLFFLCDVVKWFQPQRIRYLNDCRKRCSFAKRARSCNVTRSSYHGANSRMAFRISVWLERAKEMSIFSRFWSEHRKIICREDFFCCVLTVR